MKYKVGDKIKFTTEKHRYTIRACNERFIIATKPFNAQKTFLYTIVDLEEGLRAADNWYCKHAYDKVEEAEEGLKELISGKIYLSHRSRIDLDLERIDVDKRSKFMYTDGNDIYGEWSSITDNERKVYALPNMQ
jgi:hypothetical protein